jgi:hypothetical protein
MRDMPKVKYVKKLVKARKTIIHKTPKIVTKITLVEGTYARPVVSMVTVTHRVRKTTLKEETRLEKMVVLKTRSIELPKLKYVRRSVARRAVRMVKEMKTIEKEVPRTIPMPLVEFPIANETVKAKADSCGCFSDSCECFGKKDCGCCFPACECAPTIISPTETEIIVVEEECTVPQDFIETITEEEPSLMMMPFEFEEPTIVEKNVTFTWPVLEWSNKTFTVPDITYVNESTMIPVETNTTTFVSKPMDIEVMREVMIPERSVVRKEIVIPVEKSEEIIEQRSVLEDVAVIEPVAIDYEEPIPNPPCHWHEIVHSHCHDVREGLTHTHQHDDQGNH